MNRSLEKVVTNIATGLKEIKGSTSRKYKYTLDPNGESKAVQTSSSSDQAIQTVAKDPRANGFAAPLSDYDYSPYENVSAPKMVDYSQSEKQPFTFNNRKNSQTGQNNSANQPNRKRVNGYSNNELPQRSGDQQSMVPYNQSRALNENYRNPENYRSGPPSLSPSENRRAAANSFPTRKKSNY